MHDELVKSLRQCAEASCAGCKYDLVQIGCRGLLQHEAADVIEELTAADVRPVVRGRWIMNDECRTVCSLCGNVVAFVSHPDRRWDFGNFCPNCGADMREES